MNLTLNVTAVTIVSTGATDKIKIDFDGPSPFPELQLQSPGKYDPSLSIETKKDYGLQWVKSIGISDDIIEVISSRS